MLALWLRQRLLGSLGLLVFLFKLRCAESCPQNCASVPWTPSLLTVEEARMFTRLPQGTGYLLVIVCEDNDRDLRDREQSRRDEAEATQASLWPSLWAPGPFSFGHGLLSVWEPCTLVGIVHCCCGAAQHTASVPVRYSPWPLSHWLCAPLALMALLMCSPHTLKCTDGFNWRS